MHARAGRSRVGVLPAPDANERPASDAGHNSFRSCQRPSHVHVAHGHRRRAQGARRHAPPRLRAAAIHTRRARTDRVEQAASAVPLGHECNVNGGVPERSACQTRDESSGCCVGAERRSCRGTVIEWNWCFSTCNRFSSERYKNRPSLRDKYPLSRIYPSIPPPPPSSSDCAAASAISSPPACERSAQAARHDHPLLALGSCYCRARGSPRLRAGPSSSV